MRPTRTVYWTLVDKEGHPYILKCLGKTAPKLFNTRKRAMIEYRAIQVGLCMPKLKLYPSKVKVKIFP